MLANVARCSSPPCRWHLKSAQSLLPIPVLTKTEADDVDRVVHREYLLSARDTFNARRRTGVPSFQDLPTNWQTVLSPAPSTRALACPTPTLLAHSIQC